MPRGDFNFFQLFPIFPTDSPAKFVQNSSMDLRNSVSTPARILVVDDHPHTAELLARALALLGPQVKVDFATSGKQALECVQGGHVDVLITDMNMSGMTGLELIEKFQERPAGSPGVSFLLTASHVPGMKIEARRLHVREVLYKPISPQKICERVRDALAEMHQFQQYKGLAPQKKFKILIADPHPDSVTLLSRYLESEGYAYIVARDGKETLEQIFQENPDLILLEADITYGDGFPVLEEIRADPSIPHIPVILLSASWISASEVHHRLSLGMDDFVSKPIDRVQLFTSIRKKLLMKEMQYANIDIDRMDG
jgi:CheY-like chemotaxis protein